jgi:hypothetical protein
MTIFPELVLQWAIDDAGVGLKSAWDVSDVVNGLHSTTDRPFLRAGALGTWGGPVTIAQYHPSNAHSR